MELEPFVAKQVSPGEPVTSQAWNEIVGGLANVVAFLQATAGTSVRVTISNTDARLSESRVVAIADNGDAIDAARPVGTAKEFTLRGLAPGAYTIRAESPGFAPGEANVTLPTDQPIALSLQKTAPFMPDVFGQELLTALAALNTSNIVVSRIVDITGREVAPANPGAEFGSTTVLAQLPERDAAVPPGATAQLVVSASLEVEATVEMPSLAGLTLSESRAVLEELGLVLGKVTTRTS
jgi:hypothetical protein